MDVLALNRARICNQDRFIPGRTRNQSHFFGSVNMQEKGYERLIMESLQPREQQGGISKYMNNNSFSQLKLLIERNNQNKESHKQKRSIMLSPFKILDAPEIKDDYYLNLLDWSQQGILAIGLAQKVYLYSPTQILELCRKQDDICSVSFHPNGNSIAIGLSTGKTDIYDIETQMLIRSLKGHTSRVSSATSTYGLTFTGSRDSKIIGHDARAYQNISMKLSGHRGEVCGLKHDASGLASGSNDNSALVWDLGMAKMRYQLLGHKAAIKALAWCPWQRNILATGGGSSDKTMKFWNIETGKLIKSIYTESQVCSLIWNKNDREILSSHGFSENQLCLWRVNLTRQAFPECIKEAELHGHKERVLHMALAPDNSTICTASADQTLRFWKVFDDHEDKQQDSKSWKLNPKFTTLR